MKILLYKLDTNEMSAAVVTMTIYDTMFDLHCNSISTTDIDTIASTTITMKTPTSVSPSTVIHTELSALNSNDLSTSSLLLFVGLLYSDSIF